MNNFYVYIHKDPRTNEVFYVGKGKAKRAWNFNKRNPFHINKINKIKSLGLEIMVELIETDKTEDQAFDLEKLWIAAYKHSGMILCNQTDGGDGLRTPSSETRKKMSMAKLGKAPGNKGKTVTEELRNKLSLSHKGKHSSPSTEFQKGVVPPTCFKKGNIPKNRKQVVDTTTGSIFQSIGEAAAALGMPYHTLKAQLNGTNPNKTTLKIKGAP